MAGNGNGRLVLVQGAALAGWAVTLMVLCVMDGKGDISLSDGEWTGLVASGGLILAVSWLVQRVRRAWSRAIAEALARHTELSGQPEAQASVQENVHAASESAQQEREQLDRRLELTAVGTILDHDPRDLDSYAVIAMTYGGQLLIRSMCCDHEVRYLLDRAGRTLLGGIVTRFVMTTRGPVEVAGDARAEQMLILLAVACVIGIMYFRREFPGLAGAARRLAGLASGWRRRMARRPGQPALTGPLRLTGYSGMPLGWRAAPVVRVAGCPWDRAPAEVDRWAELIRSGDTGSWPVIA